MANGWTLERRSKHAEAIKRWKPWAQSTGPVTPEGKQQVSRNAWKGGHRARMRELTKMVNAEVRRARDLVTDCTR